MLLKVCFALPLVILTSAVLVSVICVFAFSFILQRSENIAYIGNIELLIKVAGNSS